MSHEPCRCRVVRCVGNILWKYDPSMKTKIFWSAEVCWETGIPIGSDESRISMSFDAGPDGPEYVEGVIRPRAMGQPEGTVEVIERLYGLLEALYTRRM